MTEEKKAEEKKAPLAMKRGLPPEQSNGLYGAEDRMMALGVNGRVTVIATLDIADIRHSDLEATRWPLIEWAQIEPLWSKTQIDAARAIHEEAYKERTGANALNFDGLGDDSANDDDDDEPDAKVSEIAPGKKAQF